jgi:trehalose 6-phosphate synthase/phosphatase
MATVSEVARLLIVSNRLPVTVRAGEGEPVVARSSGGLATGLDGPHSRSGGIWIGWPGSLEGLGAAARADVERRLAELRLAPVALSADEVARYYEGYANGVLWPLLHYSVARLPAVVSDLEAYEAVNARFADAVAERWREGDVVWVHDYQLMLVPKLLRERIPGARIGFFLHIPFPSSEIFRVLPRRERLLEGVLGADLVGFHAPAYVRHFASSALRLLGAPTRVDRIAWEGRDVRIGVFPMGVDAARFDETARSEDVRALVESHRAAGMQLLVGVDRLDYTKGIPRRLLAFETLLRHHPELRERVRLVQVAVPSRENVEAYREYRDEVDALVGRIHGEFATPDWSPIHYLYRALAFEEVVALYRAADAALVTPLRDGMNLVAKEFVAARPDEDGVLVLSEFAGAAAELAEAVLVNPYDVEATAEAMHRALTMPADERQTRMVHLRARVARHDVHWWARTFLGALEAADGPARADVAPSPRAAVDAAVARAADAARACLLLDYDGTLIPFARTPDLARPDAELCELLARLAALPGTSVHVVSGRRRSTLERWLGALAVGLHAEHGYWSRRPGGEWTSLDPGDTSWREPVRSILRDFSERTPGSLVEEKTVGFAWHWRGAEPELGDEQARELSLHLSTLLSSAPVELLPGDKVLEVRPHGVNKGQVVRGILEGGERGALLVALGDDRTDEDLFAAVPADGISVHVGPAPSGASLRVPDVRAARRLLARVAAEREARARAGGAQGRRA